jgi:predicted MPP superfamily phosphohydrolase
VEKPLTRPLTIVAASDIHLGTIVGRRRFERIVDAIDDLQPDLILLPGDIVDEDLAPVIRANLGEHLRALHAPMGVYAITGNHEYIGGVEAAVAYLREHGITVLRDSSVVLDGGLTLVGREDRSVVTMAGKTRKGLKELMGGVDSSRPVILMDHQPFHLEEAVEAGVDLQLSGHTHHGQLWPLNLITRAVYEVSWGYLRKGKTHIYVSSGIGSWGPPVRTGNHPELVRILLKPVQASRP